MERPLERQKDTKISQPLDTWKSTPPKNTYPTAVLILPLRMTLDLGLTTREPVFLLKARGPGLCRDALPERSAHRRPSFVLHPNAIISMMLSLYKERWSQ